MSANDSVEAVRQRFLHARQKHRRAKDAAEAAGLSEGQALAAFARSDTPVCEASALDAPVATYPLAKRWVELLASLQACGPLMALTRNETTVHEKTGVYERVSGQNDGIGLVLGRDIDLRLFFKRWHGGMLVLEADGSSGNVPKSSLQFFDERGVAVHKIFPVSATDRHAWQQCVQAWIDPRQSLDFDPQRPSPPQRARHVEQPDALLRDWAAMTNTHQFFDVLKKHDVEREAAFAAVEGEYTSRVDATALRRALEEAAFEGLSIMVFVGNSGCIQIHTGPVQRVEPMSVHGQDWLNILDPGFNLHLREDRIGRCWVVRKPTADGIVSSLEVFDSDGELMLMLFGERKPGIPEQTRWTTLLDSLCGPQPAAIST